MNRKIRMIVLAVLLVAGGGYLWLQQSATAVKPAQTTNAAAKKPLAPTATKTAAAATKPAPGATAPVNAASKPAPVPQANATAPAAKPAAVPQPQPAASAASAKPAPAAVPASAPAPVTPPAQAALASTPVEEASWHEQLQKGAFLAETVRPRLPEGTDLVMAAAGFRDLQQFVATVNASHNLKLSFDELKRRVVTDRKGLASAIDAMKKVASATIEEQRAEYEARGLIQEAKRHPLPPAPAPRAVSTREPAAKKPIRSRAGV